MLRPNHRPASWGRKVPGSSSARAARLHWAMSHFPTTLAGVGESPFASYAIHPSSHALLFVTQKKKKPRTGDVGASKTGSAADERGVAWGTQPNL
jgi:hypothetical protein